MISISYAILVKNEIDEFGEIFRFLVSNIDNNDEICVLQDSSCLSNSRKSVQEIISNSENKTIKYDLRFLDDFSKQRNHLKSMCSKDYIFMIDADELIDKFLVDNIKAILASNEEIELFKIPRINRVIGYNTEDVIRYGWVIDEHDRINFPDFQSRIIKNKPEIFWCNPVHEVVVGHKIVTELPMDSEYCLHHTKHIDRQRKQNKFYEEFIK